MPAYDSCVLWWSKLLLRRLGIVLFLAAVPIFLIATNVRWVANAPLLYRYGFDKYDISAWTGIERGELLLAGKQIRDYFNNKQEYLDMQVVVSVIRYSLYDSREVQHMRDVKEMIRGVYRVQELAGAYIAAFAIGGLVVARRRFLSSLGQYVSIGGFVTIGLVLIVGLASVVAFEHLFLAFHYVGFSNDLW